ncbi:MAG: hydantoinase/oxoprolinase family protein [Pseudomonadota bacterium]
MQIGVDTGGTFTDLIGWQPDGNTWILKVPSTPHDPSEAVLAGIAELLTMARVAPGAVRQVAHGTTVATNAVLERKGARTGIIATRGFRDVLEIGRQIRTAVYELALRPETPVFLAPGARRVEVDERVDANGDVLLALDESSVITAVDQLVAQGVESVAVALLFSFLKPDHETRVREIIRARYPGLAVSLSCEVDPSFREYERTVVTAFDAYTKPVLAAYLKRLVSGLRSAGVDAPVQVMQSRGGVASAMLAAERPVRLFLSGPAAGVVGGAATGRAAEQRDLITIDVGGTSCDIALINDAKPLVRPEGRIDGFPVRVPMVDVNAIGAGGGSIAWLDSSGGLRVGPHSAGAVPGPACYGQGGALPTVTDAALVLGYLDADRFADGRVALDRALSERAIAEHLATPLGLSVNAAALGIQQVVNAQMAEGTRLVSIKQGLDPREFTLVALGGAGPLHAPAIAAELDMREVLFPRYPGVLSAAGLLQAPTEHEASVGFPCDLDDADHGAIVACIERLDRQTRERMATEGVDAGASVTRHFADVCYVGQSHYLEVPIHLDDAEPLTRLYADFVATHARVFGYSTDSPARIVNLRAVESAAPTGAPYRQSGPARAGATPAPSIREATFDAERGPEPVNVWERERLAPDWRADGPLIVTQSDTTVLIPAGWHARMLASGDILASR